MPAPHSDFVLPHDAHWEVVERKGIGHPDTLADAIAELASIRFSQYCQRNFGAVLHHNLDKVAVLGGLARFGDADGHYVRPLRVIIGGRAAHSFAGTAIPVADILTTAAHEQLRTALPGYERITVDVHVETTDSSKFPHKFHPRGLHDLPERTRVTSNDTAYLVAVSQNTRAELIALASESWLAAQPWSGSDIKVLVLRTGRRFEVTVGVPALAGQVDSSPQFRDLLTDAEQQLTTLMSEQIQDEAEILFRCNAETVGTRVPLSRQYFTVSGSAIDYGEEGLVGRGNSRHGLISPGHAAGNEVTFGKNPTYHVGKVGAWLADHAAAELDTWAGPCRVGLAWRIGAAYPDPAFVQITTRHPEKTAAAEQLVRDALTTQDWLHNLVDGERYRPRIEPLERLLSRLRHAQ
jgi:S-adenosylmethionine synthetase